MTLATSPTFGEILRAQSGVISRQQAAEAGMTMAAIDNKLRSERWQRMHQGVYATFSGVPDRQAQLWAVVLRAGPQAALSFRTAAELYGLAREGSPLIHVTVPRNQRIKPIRGAVIHYSHAADRRRHPTLRPPRTRVEDTVLDLTQVSANFDEAFDWLCRGVGRLLTTPGQLRAALQSRPRARWRDELLLALGDIAEGARSLLERRYVTGVERAHGLPAAQRQAKIVTGNRTRYVDNLYEEAKLAVELDGRAAHPPEQRWDDSHRDNELASVGVLTVRYNWADVNNRACSVAAQVGELLRIRGTAVRLRRCGPSCSTAQEAPECCTE